MTKRETVSKTFRIDSETCRRIEVLAKHENRTFNNMVDTLLKRFVAEREAAKR